METTKNQKMNPATFFFSDQKEGLRSFRSVTLVDQIARALKDDIFTGKQRGGDQLLEDRLKDKFGVSRTPLREAFRLLKKDGLIEIKPRKGAFVRRITRQDIEENFPVRAILEGLAARLAYPNFTQQDIEEMETLITLLRNLRMHTLWHRYTYQYYKEDFKNSLMIHRKIIDLFKEKKISPEEIEKAVRQHIEVALGPFLIAMEKLE
jgi:DNA-binding GntR family transcriptional regulator